MKERASAPEWSVKGCRRLGIREEGVVEDPGNPTLLRDTEEGRDMFSRKGAREKILLEGF